MAKSVKLQEVAIDLLKPYERNAKIHPQEQVEKIKESINEFGFVTPCVIDENYNLIAGHGRVEAAKQMGLETVPCVFVEGLSEAQRKAYILADNRLGDLGEWDMDIVFGELEDLQAMDFDIEVTGFEMPEEIPEVFEDDFEPVVPTEPRTKLGDLWKLGSHRLICGDSTDPAVIDRLMDGVKADCVFTDPPYGMKKESEGVLNDNLNYDDLLDFNRQWIPLTFGALKDNGSWYCWGIDEPLMDIYSNILKPMAKENKITFRNLITWDKGNGQGQLSEDFRMYPIADEKCLFVMCGEQDMRFKRNLEEFNEMFEPIRKWFEDERKKSGLSVEQISKIDSTRCSHYWAKVQFEFPTKEAFCKIQTYCVNNGINAFGVEYEEIKKEYEEIKKEFYKNRAYFNNTHDNINNVWHFDRAGKDEREHTGGHATPKPIALCSRAIKSSSREEEIVLDVFGGSGSTLIACEQLNRKCYMCELDPKYCSVILQRYINFKGSDADVFLLKDGEKIPYSKVKS